MNTDADVDVELPRRCQPLLAVVLCVRSRCRGVLTPSLDESCITKQMCSLALILPIWPLNLQRIENYGDTT